MNILIFTHNHLEVLKMTKQERISALEQESRDLYNQSQWMSTSALDRIDARQEAIAAEIEELKA